MNEIEKAIITSLYPKLKVGISQFRHKTTGEIRWAVMQVNGTHKVFNGQEWDMLDSQDVENTDMIREVLIEAVKG